jgi:uncharacterized membrane protein
MKQARSAAADRGPVGYERTVAFSDGVFAIAITLLVLGIDVPDVPKGRLWDAIGELGPSLLSYFIGFAVIGVFWFSHHRFFDEVRRFDARIVRLNIVYLSLISLMPFTTGMLGNYGDVSVAVAIYAGNVAAVALIEGVMTALALRDGLLVAGPRRRRRLLASGLIVPVVFGASIPIAFLDPDAAMWSWLALAVIPRVLRHAGLLTEDDD